MQASPFTSHPWHGVATPPVATAFIEIVPSGTIKYEIDKAAGLVKVYHPQKHSLLCPTLYGFIPQTYCDENVRLLANDEKVKILPFKAATTHNWPFVMIIDDSARMEARG